MNNCKVFLFSRSCCAGKNTLYYSNPISDQPKLPRLWPGSNAFDTGLGEVTIKQDHSWLEGQVFGKRGGWNGLGAKRGEDGWPWIKLWCSDVVQWAAVVARYKAYDRFFSWKCITALGLRPSKFSRVLERILNKNRQSFYNCQLTFFPVAYTQMLTHIYTPRIQTQTCTCIFMPPYIYLNASTHAIETRRLFAQIIDILTKPPQL